MALASALALLAACSDGSALAIALLTDSIAPGKTVQLTATRADADGEACGDCRWASSDTSVATVSHTGLLDWRKPGTATITASRPSGARAAVTVTVFERPDPTPEHGHSGRVRLAETASGCSTEIFPGDDIQPKVDSCPGGTAFTIKTGVHRLQSVTPKSGMSFTGEPGEGAIMSGARLLTSFSREEGYWVATGQVQEGERGISHWGGGKPVCRSTHPRCNYPEDLFIAGVPLRHVTSLAQVGPGTWYFDYAGDRIYFADNPEGQVVETSVTPRAFGGSASNVIIRNLIIEKYATPNTEGTIHGYSGTGWLVEGNEVRWNHGGGIRTGTRMVARRNYSHHNGQYGFSGSGANVLVDENEIAYNNTAGVSTTWGAGGSKFHNTRHLVLRRNFVHHNKGPGLWTDINNIYTLIEHNRVEENAGMGIFHEISYDAVIRYNTAVRNGSGNRAILRGGGIAVTSSPNVEIYGNTVTNNKQGIAINEDNRGSGAYGVWEVRNLHVHDNTVTMAVGYTGLNVRGTDLSYYTTKNNRFVNNTYNLGPSAKYFFWQKRARTQAEWRAYGQDATGTFRPLRAASALSRVTARSPLVISLTRSIGTPSHRARHHAEPPCAWRPVTAATLWGHRVERRAGCER